MILLKIDYPGLGRADPVLLGTLKYDLVLGRYDVVISSYC